MVDQRRSRGYASRGLTLRQMLPSYTERQPNGCLHWTGTVNRAGYAITSRGGIFLRAHRALYAEVNGPVDEGEPVEHACHSRDAGCSGGPTCLHRRCVELEHLEVTTQLENLQRGRGCNRRDKLTCKCGLPYDGTAPIKGGRYRRRTCSVCNRRRTREARERKRG
jgi:hypothetical protein